MNSNQAAEKDIPAPDPVYVNSRREAIIIFRVWLCALLWAIPCSYLLGYTHEFDPAQFSTVWGIPTWIFWGIGVYSGAGIRQAGCTTFPIGEY